MRPKNWSRENFTDMRRASVTTCFVWFDLEQEHGKQYHSYEDDLYAMNRPGKKPLYLISQPRGFRQLKAMLASFVNPLSRTFKPDGFVRAEIYENFTGQTIWQCKSNMTEVEDATNNEMLFSLDFKTVDNLRQPGRHRILNGILSKRAGMFVIDDATMKTHLNFSWIYWMANSKFKPIPTYNYAQIVKEAIQ